MQLSSSELMGFVSSCVLGAITYKKLTLFFLTLKKEHYLIINFIFLGTGYSQIC